MDKADKFFFGFIAAMVAAVCFAGYMYYTTLEQAMHECAIKGGVYWVKQNLCLPPGVAIPLTGETK